MQASKRKETVVLEVSSRDLVHNVTIAQVRNLP
jgi:hypothetical protein